MIAVPLLGARYVHPIQQEILTLTEPARTQLTHLQLALALEGAALDDYLETRDSRLLERFNQVHSQEAAAFDALAPLVARLGPDVQRRLDELRDINVRRHARAEQLIKSAGARKSGGDRTQKDLYEDVLVAAAQLDESINDSGQVRRARIFDAERIERRVTLTLGALGFLAIAVAIWLARQLQDTAQKAEQRRQALESAVESRARLMRGVSHDLKNPLNAILGHSQLIEEGTKGPVTEGQRESLRRIRRAVNTQLTLIKDILDLSRVEAGQLEINPEPVKLFHVATEAVQEQSAAALAAGHTMTLECEAKPQVVTDPERVRQILGNLLSNAVKYTPPGGQITVKVCEAHGEGRLSGTHAAEIIVKDTGPGIPRDKMEAVFSEFTRLDPGVAEGSGLGLAIARRIARLLGGDITVSSDESGAAFALWLPLAPDRAVAASENA